MACERAREVVLGQPTLAPASDELFHARQHIERCGLCRQYISKEDQWRDVFRKRLASGAAPAGLRIRLEQMISGRGDRSSWRFRAGPWVIAASILLAFSVGGLSVWGITRWKRVTVAEELVGEFVLNLPQATEIVAAGPEELVKKAEAELGVRIEPPPLRGMRVESGKICTLMSKAAALFHYRGLGPSLSLYVFEDPGLSLPEWRPMRESEPEYYSYSKNGINVVMWRQDGLAYTLVSSASPKQIVAMLE
ncbi:MAG: hypothetical protein HYT87_14695 [Nitrospirae bacterium]|nr:hypothetical protein [Nitrospirota bacterium]